MPEVKILPILKVVFVNVHVTFFPVIIFRHSGFDLILNLAGSWIVILALESIDSLLEKLKLISIILSALGFELV